MMMVMMMFEFEVPAFYRTGEFTFIKIALSISHSALFEAL